jgi:hypothetical protein
LDVNGFTQEAFSAWRCAARSAELGSPTPVWRVVLDASSRPWFDARMAMRKAVVLFGLVLAVGACEDNKSAKDAGLDCAAVAEHVKKLAPEASKDAFAMVYKGSCDGGNLSAKNYKCIMGTSDYESLKACSGE